MSARADLERQERTARRADEEAAHQQRDPRLDSVVALQRSLGNASVARLLGRRRRNSQRPAPAPAGPGRLEEHAETQSFQFNAAIRIGRQQRRPSDRHALAADTDSPKHETPHEELQAIEAVAGEPLAATTLAAASAAPPGVVPSTPEALAEQAPPSEDATVAPHNAPASPDAATAEATAQASADPASTKEVTLSLPDIEVRDFETVNL
jgi:hypothetical protein